jgi:hypothetical protein
MPWTKLSIIQAILDWIAQVEPYVLAKVLLHMLKHPKMSVPYSLNLLVTEVICLFEQEIHLMLPNSPDVLPQSSNMLGQCTYSAWQKISLML